MLELYRAQIDGVWGEKKCTVVHWFIDDRQDAKAQLNCTMDVELGTHARLDQLTLAGTKSVAWLAFEAVADLRRRPGRSTEGLLAKLVLALEAAGVDNVSVTNLMRLYLSAPAEPTLGWIELVTNQAFDILQQHFRPGLLCVFTREAEVVS